MGNRSEAVNRRRTMAKRKGAKDNDQKKRDEEQWPKEKGRRDKQ